MKKLRKNWPVFLVLGLILANLLVWVSVAQYSPHNFVQVSFLDIGQGDAILIQGKTGNHILIDDGPGKIILRRLKEEMPLFDRSIDILVETHPDKDHIGGTPFVFETYKVGEFFEPGVESNNSIDDEIRNEREKLGIKSTLARSGMVLDFHDGSYLRILFPDRDVEGWETNSASIVAEYVFGKTCFLFTGDSPSKIEDYLVSIYGNQLKCQVLKAGHHGSKYSTDDNYLSTVRPDIAIISAGKNNSYGHPNPETLDRLKNHNVKVLNTIDLGTITLLSDGEKIWQK